jgi:hypothetical protein
LENRMPPKSLNQWGHSEESEVSITHGF